MAAGATPPPNLPPQGGGGQTAGANPPANPQQGPEGQRPAPSRLAGEGAGGGDSSSSSLRVGPFAAFGNPGYGPFWCSSVLASMGISMQVAISQWQVYQLTNSPLQL